MDGHGKADRDLGWKQHVLALEAAGGLAWWRGDYPACSRAYAAALELRRAGDDKAALAAAGMVAAVVGSFLIGARA